MDLDGLMRIVRDEQLETPVVYGAGRLSDEAVVLERDGDRWRVFIVNERATPIESTVRSFDDESSALEHVLLKLRQTEAARAALEALRNRRDAPKHPGPV